MSALPSDEALSMTIVCTLRPGSIAAIDARHWRSKSTVLKLTIVSVTSGVERLTMSGSILGGR
jgi:hypothetical protein